MFDFDKVIDKGKGVKFNSDSEKTNVDDEQLGKYEEIRKLLVAAGYFRAMIKDIDPFDIVCGGLAWAIASSNVSVDVSLLFQEGLRLGERMGMAENIERSLIKMKCPHALAAQQIYFLICTNIFPVVKWLVANVLEVKKEMGDDIRQYSESQFYKYNEDVAEKDEEIKAVEYVNLLQETYSGKRKYKLKKGKRPSRIGRKKSEEDQLVLSVLIEYGQEHLYTQDILKQKNSEEKKDTDVKKEAREATKRAEKMKGNMDAIDSGSSVKTSALGQMLSKQRDVIESAKNKLEGDMEEVDNLNAQNQKEHGEATHERYMKDLNKKIENAKQQIEVFEVSHHKEGKKLGKINEVYNEKLAEKKALEGRYNELLKKETPENKKILERLQSLVSVSLSLKDQLDNFKTTIGTQMEVWGNRIGELEDYTPDDDGKSDKIVRIHEEDTQNLKDLKTRLIKRNRRLCILKRKIDEVPSRKEIQQYNRQFVEVFDQMNIKFTETKSYFNMYNSSEDLRLALNNEISLLESIQEQYPQARKSKRGKEALVASLTNILDNLSVRKNKVQDKLDYEVKRRDQLDETYITFVTRERDFYTMTLEYQAECAKNEKLAAKYKKVRKAYKKKK